jgi:hypothetical protein
LNASTQLNATQLNGDATKRDTTKRKQTQFSFDASGRSTWGTGATRTSRNTLDTTSLNGRHALAVVDAVLFSRMLISLTLLNLTQF